VLSQTLRQWEFEVTVVSDGAEALRYCSAGLEDAELAILAG